MNGGSIGKNSLTLVPLSATVFCVLLRVLFHGNVLTLFILHFFPLLKYFSYLNRNAVLRMLNGKSSRKAHRKAKTHSMGMHVTEFRKGGCCVNTHKHINRIQSVFQQFYFIRTVFFCLSFFPA